MDHGNNQTRSAIPQAAWCQLNRGRIRRLLGYDAESGAFLATHERCYSTVGMKTHLLPEHLTPEEKRTRLSPDQWVNVFSSRIGIDRSIAEKSVAQAFKSDFNGRRLCGVVCSSKRSYPLLVIERAMQAMLDTDIWGIGCFQKQCETIQILQVV